MVHLKHLIGTVGLYAYVTLSYTIHASAMDGLDDVYGEENPFAGMGMEDMEGMDPGMGMGMDPGMGMGLGDEDDPLGASANQAEEIVTKNDLNFLLNGVKTEEYHFETWFGQGRPLVLGVFNAPDEDGDGESNGDEEGKKMKEEGSAAGKVIEEFVETGPMIKARTGAKVAYAISKEIAKEFNVNENEWKIFVYPDPRFISEKHGDRIKFRFPGSGKYHADALIRFVNEKGMPLVTRLTFDSAPGLAPGNREGTDRATILLISKQKVDPKQDAKYADYLTSRLRRVASAIKEKYPNQFSSLRFAICDESGLTNDFDNSYFPWKQIDSTTKGSWERKIAIRKDDLFYAMQDEFTPERAIEFVDKFLQGKLEGKPLPDESERAPYKNSEGSEPSAIEDLSKQGLEDLLTKMSGTHLFIMFHANWCGHCKSMMPELESLARSESSNEKIVIAKMEASSSELPSIFPPIDGFPTLYFVPKVSMNIGKRPSPVSYNGDRSMAAMKEFIKEQISKYD